MSPEMIFLDLTQLPGLCCKMVLKLRGRMFILKVVGFKRGSNFGLRGEVRIMRPTFEKIWETRMGKVLTPSVHFDSLCHPKCLIVETRNAHPEAPAGETFTSSVFA